MSFGVNSIASACTLSYQIYDRCNAARGEFKSLSVRALSLHDILKIIETTWQQQHLSSEQHTSLINRLPPLVNLLESIHERLRKYDSLGTASPKLSDKINWALTGGGAEIRDELDAQLQGLIAWNTTSLLLQRGYDPSAQSPAPIINMDASPRWPDLTSVTVQPPVVDHDSNRNSSNPARHEIVPHAIWQVAQFLVFLLLSVLAFGIILTACCFYFIGFLFFPLMELTVCCTKCGPHWKSFNAFFKKILNTMFRFIRDLWE